MSIRRVKRQNLLCASALLLLASLHSAPRAQTLAHPGWVGSGISADLWWKNAVFYQVDPLSFQDSNGDGFGDFNGIASRLDYIQALGVDGIILSPLQTHAQPRQSGRPATPPRLFDPAYGSDDDFDNLVRQASSRRIRIVVDLPLSGAQPIDSLIGVARFWFSRGVAGLRLVRDAGDQNAGVAPLTPYQIGERVQQLRKVATGFAGQRILLGDLGSESPAAPIDPAITAPVGPTPPQSSGKPMHGGTTPLPPISESDSAPPPPQLQSQPQLQVDLHIAMLPGVTGPDLRQALGIVSQPPHTPAPVPVFASDTNNRQRSMDRYGDGHHDIGIAQVLATALLINRSAALIYYGQEIGMTTYPPVATKQGGNGFGHAGDPVPMQWTRPGTKGGFTGGTPWIESAPGSATTNVQAEESDPRSLLRWYRQLSALHHGNPTIRDGSTTLLQVANPDVVVWVRRSAQATAPPVFVVCNVSAHPVRLSLTAEVKAAQFHGTYFHTLLRSGIDAVIAGPASVESMSLPAYGVYIGELHR